jgi:hypothetical protein
LLLLLLLLGLYNSPPPLFPHPSLFSCQCDHAVHPFCLGSGKLQLFHDGGREGGEEGAVCAWVPHPLTKAAAWHPSAIARASPAPRPGQHLTGGRHPGMRTG